MTSPSPFPLPVPAGPVRQRAVSDARNAPNLRLFTALGFVETVREAVEVKGEPCIDVTLLWHAGP